MKAKKLIIFFIILLSTNIFGNNLEQILRKAQREKSLEKAVNYLDKAFKIAPKDPLINYTKAFIYYHRKNTKKAVLQFKKIIKKARNLREKFYYLNKIHQLTTFIENDKIRRVYQQGTKLIREGKYQSAINLLYKVLNQRKNKVNVFLALAKAFSGLNDKRYELYYLKKAYKINPLDSKVLGELKYYYKKNRLNKQLLIILVEIMNVYGTNPYLNYDKAFTLMKLNQEKKAEQLLMKWIKKEHTFPLYYLRLGQIQIFINNKIKEGRSNLKLFLSKIKKESKYEKYLKKYYPIDLFIKKAKSWLKN